MARTIEQAPRPANYTGGRYEFFLHTASATLWKTQLTKLDVERQDGVDGAANQVTLTLTTSPCDATGAAIMEDAKAIISEPASVTFNQHDLAQSDFAPRERILDLIQNQIEQNINRKANRAKVVAIIQGWGN